MIRMRDRQSLTDRQLDDMLRAARTADIAARDAAFDVGAGLAEVRTRAAAEGGAPEVPAWHMPQRAASGMPPLRRVAALTTLTAIALVAVLFATTWAGGERRVSAEEVDDGRLRVVVDQHTSDDPETVRARLEAAGIDVTVDRVPGSPSTVGGIANLLVDRRAPGVEPTDGLDGGNEVFQATIDPRVFTGTVTLVVPRAAERGEYYEVAGSPFAEGEALEGLPCEQWPLTARQLERAAADRGAPVQWEVVTFLRPNADAPMSDVGYQGVTSRPEGRVLFVSPITVDGLRTASQSPRTLVATVLPDSIQPTPDVARKLSPEAGAQHCPDAG